VAKPLSACKHKKTSINVDIGIPMMAMFLLQDKFWATIEPKSLGASQHPDEGVCQFESLILAMSQSSDTLLDHVADYLRFISNTKKIWFSLNTSYDHGCYLASRFCLDP